MAQDAAIIPRQHAQNGIKAAVELERAANNVGIGVQALAPETVAHHRGLAAFVTLRVQVAQSRADAEDIEEIGAGGHLPGDLVVRSDAPIHIEKAGFKRQILKDSGAPKIAISGVADFGVYAGQSVRLAGAQIVQDHFANDAVDGDVSADAERDGSNRNDSEAWGFAETSRGVANVSRKRHEFRIPAASRGSDRAPGRWPQPSSQRQVHFPESRLFFQR